jgi:NADH:ubiquinone oxidoreductase subunit 6 (subunit J)
MTDVLFFLAAALAIFGAAVMLMSRNAVHSALGLVATMGALAFLFLMLDAPFLAMIQITVYAGAIMVLFIFVIMLLGAEKLDLHEPFRWMPALGVTLASALFFGVALPIFGGQLDQREMPLPAPQVRVVHAAPDVAPVSIALNGETVAEGLAFRDATAFLEVPAGDYSVTVTPEGGDPITTALTFEQGSTQTIIAYGEGAAPSFAVVPDDLSTVGEARSSRLTVFNAYLPDTPVSLVDFGSEFDDGDTVTVVDNVPYGTASSAVIAEEGEKDWSYIIGAGGASVNPGLDNIVTRTREYELDRDQSQLLIVTSERNFNGGLSGVLVPVSVEARAAFGRPRAIGTLLFIDYMLPFQLLAILLLAAMVGVIVLTHRHVSPVKQRVNVRRRVARPLTSVIASQVGHEVVEDAPQLPAETEQRETAGD